MHCGHPRSELNRQELAVSAWAFATLSVQNKPLLDAIGNAVMERVAAFGMLDTIRALLNWGGAELGSMRHVSGKEKQHKHILFGPDFPRTFLTLTPGCPGFEKFLPISGAAEKHTFRRGRP